MRKRLANPVLFATPSTVRKNSPKRASVTKTRGLSKAARSRVLKLVPHSPNSNLPPVSAGFPSEHPSAIQQQRDRPVVDRVDFHHFPKNSGFDCKSAFSAFCSQKVI